MYNFTGKLFRTSAPSIHVTSVATLGPWCRLTAWNGGPITRGLTPSPPEANSHGVPTLARGGGALSQDDYRGPWSTDGRAWNPSGAPGT